MLIDRFPYKVARKYPKKKPVPPEVVAFLSGASGRVEIVKERTKRSVFAVYGDKDTTHPIYYLKYDHPLRWSDKVKGPLRPKVKKEYLITRCLSDLKVPVVEPVFCAWTAFQGIFVSKAVVGVNFDDQWRRVKNAPNLRQAFLTSWRALILAVLQNNLYHPDFHAGNIMAVQDGQVFSCFLIDVVDVKICRRLSEWRILQNLRSLEAMYHELNQEERAFMVSDLPGCLRNMPALEIWNRLRQHSVQVFYRKGWRHLKERVYDKESLVHIIDDNERICRLRKDVLSLPQALAVIAAHKNKPAGDSSPEFPVKEWPGVKATTVKSQETAYFVYEYDKKKPFFFSPPEIISWFNSWGMHTAGFAVPRPLALIGEKGRSRYVIFDSVSGENLAGVLSRAESRSDGSLDILFQRLYAYLCRMYAWKIIPIRIKLTDFMVTPEGRLFFIACNNLKFNCRITKRSWTNDIRRLARDMPPGAAEAFWPWLRIRGDPPLFDFITETMDRW